MEPNLLANGRFLHTLGNWNPAGGAVYSAGDGDDHYGVAVLPTGGGAISQIIAIPRARSYSLHLAVKAIGSGLTAGQATIAIVDGSGSAVKTISLTGTADTWTDNDLTIGLAPGTTYTLTIRNVSAAGDVRIDDVWLWWVPATRAQLAERVNRKLDQLASDASLSVTPAGAQTEGSYTDAIDAGLRSIGAIDPETDLPDVRWLTSEKVALVLDEVEREILERLQRRYLLLVDISSGDRDEKLSQIAAAIGRLTSSGGSGGGSTGKVVTRTLRHRAEDFTL